MWVAGKALMLMFVFVPSACGDDPYLMFVFVPSACGDDPYLMFVFVHSACGDDPYLMFVFFHSACNNFPCLNGGTCNNQPGGLFTCTCAVEFAGDQCEINTSEY